MRILQVFVIVNVVLVAVRGGEETQKHHTHPYDTLQPDKVVGVTSVAGITSRNGRLSSIGGIKFFTPDSAHYANSLNYPLTVFTEKDGNFATGSVRFHPEGKGVSASASAGHIPPGSAKRPITYFMKPFPDLFDFSKHQDPWFARYDEFGKNEEPWFPKDMYKPFGMARPNFGLIKNDWIYPRFDPFINFWR